MCSQRDCVAELETLDALDTEDTSADQDDPAPEPEEIPAPYREILNADHAMRPKTLCRALGTGEEPKNIEDMCRELKRRSPAAPWRNPGPAYSPCNARLIA